MLKIKAFNRAEQQQKAFLTSEQGFTLVEILISMVVLSLVLIGIVTGNVAIQKNTEAAFQRTQALQDANQVMEAIRKAARTGVFPANVTAAYPHAGTVSGYTSLPSEVITVSYTDTNADGNRTNDNPLDITVNVAWLQNGTRTATASLRSLVTLR